MSEACSAYRNIQFTYDFVNVALAAVLKEQEHSSWDQLGADTRGFSRRLPFTASFHTGFAPAMCYRQSPRIPISSDIIKLTQRFLNDIE